MKKQRSSWNAFTQTNLLIIIRRLPWNRASFISNIPSNNVQLGTAVLISGLKWKFKPVTWQIRKTKTLVSAPQQLCCRKEIRCKTNKQVLVNISYSSNTVTPSVCETSCPPAKSAHHMLRTAWRKKYFAWVDQSETLCTAWILINSFHIHVVHLHRATCFITQ